MMLVSALALSLLTAGDPVVEIQSDLTHPDAVRSIRAYQAAGTVVGALGAPVASDLEFGTANGKKPTLWTFPADFDGDGSDEICFVRNRSLKKGKIQDLQLLVHEPPPVWDSNAVKVASTKKKTLGSALDDGAIVLIGAVDSDGDGKDEALVVREWSDGRQSLELRKLPKKKNKKMKKAFASDETFGTSQVDWTMAAFGSDVDGDGDEEIVCLRRGVGQPDRLLVFEPPTTLDGETGDPVLSDVDVDPTDGGMNFALARIDRDGDDVDELAFIRTDPSSGGMKLEIVGLPASVGGEIGPVEFTEPQLLVPSDAHDVVTVFGLRGYTAVPPKPPEDLSGTWTASFSHLANGVPETLPTLNGLNAIMSGGSTFAILLPTFHQAVGTYSPDDGTIDFGASPHKLDVPSTGSTYSLNLGIASVSIAEGELTITGTYTGTKDPPIGPEQTVTAGTFTWTRTAE